MSVRRPRLRTTLVVVLVGVVAALCLLIAAVTHGAVRDQLDRELDAQLTRAADRAEEAPPPGDAGPGDQGQGEQGPGPGEFELSARVEGGAVVEASWRDGAGQIHELPAADRAALAELDGADPSDVPLSLGTYRVVLADDGTIVGLPRAPGMETLSRLNLALGLASAAAVAIAGVAGWFLVGRALRPLESVAGVAARVADQPLARGDVTLDDRVPDRIARSGTEAGDVGRALNHLLASVGGALETRARAEASMRRFVADASHELRTPLTAVRGYADMLRLTESLGDRGEQSVERIEAQAERMASLVEDLLLLARLDEGLALAVEDVDLVECALDAVTDAQVTAPEHRWRLDVPDEPVVVLGEARRLTQVVVNLVANAARHTPAGTEVTVGVAERGDEAVLTVRDDGPGFDPELDVFARFSRADAARTGRGEGTTGLGLAIVRTVVEAHGGTVTARSAPGGTTFEVRLPRSGGDAD